LRASTYEFNTGLYMKLTCAVLGLLSLTGCASIVGGSSQVVSVETRKGPDVLSGAACKLTNNKGTWFLTTPGTVTVHRAYDDLSIKCEKDGSEPGITTVKSSTKGMAFGNILFGGVIGVAVDAGTGAAYDYPALITVAMGMTTTIAPPVAPPAGVESTTAAKTAGVESTTAATTVTK